MSSGPKKRKSIDSKIVDNASDSPLLDKRLCSASLKDDSPFRKGVVSKISSGSLGAEKVSKAIGKPVAEIEEWAIRHR
jgi:hypothetical protein